MDIKYYHNDLAYNTFAPECAIFLSISSIKQIWYWNDNTSVYDSALTSQTYVMYINFKPPCKVKVKQNTDIWKINTAFIFQTQAQMWHTYSNIILTCNSLAFE